MDGSWQVFFLIPDLYAYVQHFATEIQNFWVQSSIIKKNVCLDDYITNTYFNWQII